ncbi:Hypothetical predicted protein [Pelobates cultripes]|uniref:Uncharacterized protein n=1 Tax=Pelobates cultripes TaxID=61616 RepID=A0AAD1REG8_PELCU|nr:Hypothetical predicted protein [Pelobates cultripes]
MAAGTRGRRRQDGVLAWRMLRLHGGVVRRRWGRLHADPLTGPPYTKAPTSVTMEVIGDLMAAHHKKISADVALIRDEFKGITDRLRKMEFSSDSHTNQIMDLQAAIKDLQQKTLQQETLMTAQEDRYRRNNLKLRGVADSIPEAELPHLIRRLLTWH